ncbi:hypothetical protein EBS02_03200 [bacterium]|nr:hypothetical protein [bacterium]
MTYYEPKETILVVTQRWQFKAGASRYFKQALAELRERLQPINSCIWKASGAKYNGYQADLIDFTIDQALDFEPGSFYPDW